MGARVDRGCQCCHVPRQSPRKVASRMLGLVGTTSDPCRFDWAAEEWSVPGRPASVDGADIARVERLRESARTSHVTQMTEYTRLVAQPRAYLDGYGPSLYQPRTRIRDTALHAAPGTTIHPSTCPWHHAPQWHRARGQASRHVHSTVMRRT